ncbi:MAG TPA: type IV pilin protein [Luteimonas sp.]|nr:type IV pilin protein [Luteimonas sp.]
MTQYSKRARAKGMQGFTLIELMVVVLVVAILAGIAFTSYDFAMVKTRRGAAEGCLMEQAQFMERYYTVGTGSTLFTYTGAVPPACSADVTPHYTVAAPTIPADGKSFTLSAVPKGRQAAKDTKCGTLTLNHQGVKGAAGDVGYCW